MTDPTVVGTTDQVPVRYCHGCEQYDRHPRVLHIADNNNPANDMLYHYDCAPEAVRTAHPEIAPGVEATAQGKRGAEVAAVMAAHGDSIPEAPADTTSEV